MQVDGLRAPLRFRHIYDAKTVTFTAKKLLEHRRPGSETEGAVKRLATRDIGLDILCTFRELCLSERYKASQTLPYQQSLVQFNYADRLRGLPCWIPQP